MSLNGVTFDLRNVRARDDARLHEKIYGDAVLAGCALTYTGAQLTVGEGALVVKGRVLVLDSAESITAAPTYPNGYGRLRLAIDLSQAASATTFTQAEFAWDYASSNSFPALTQQDINDGSNMNYSATVAIVKFTSGNISSITSRMATAVERQPIITATGMLKGDGSGGVTAAVAGTDYVATATVTGKQDKITASGILKGAGGGNVSAAVAGTDYATPASVALKDNKPLRFTNVHVLTSAFVELDRDTMGENLFDGELYQGQYDSTGALTASAYYVCTTNVFKVTAGQTYACAFKLGGVARSAAQWVWFNGSTFISRTSTSVAPANATRCAVNFIGNGSTQYSSASVGAVMIARGSASTYLPPLPAAYTYKVDIPLTGCTAAMTPDVCFEVAGSSIFASVARTMSGSLRIYAKGIAGANVTIPCITLWQEVS